MQIVYDGLIEITIRHIGSSGKSYIDRRCRISLNLDKPELVKVNAIDRLIDGINLSIEVYLDDSQAKQYLSELSALKKKY